MKIVPSRAKNKKTTCQTISFEDIRDEVPPENTIARSIRSSILETVFYRIIQDLCERRVCVPQIRRDLIRQAWVQLHLIICG